MTTARRKVRHPGAGINRHKARLARRLKRGSERLHDLAIELELVDRHWNARQVRAASHRMALLSDDLHQEATAS